MSKLAFLLIITISICSCKKDDDNTEAPTNVAKSFLVDLFNKNPTNTLGWDIDSDNIETWQGVILNEDGALIELTSLDLEGNELLSIPVELSNLTNLTELFLGVNKLTQYLKKFATLDLVLLYL